MTTTVAPTTVGPPATGGAGPALRDDRLSRCLDWAATAADAADVLGLDSQPLREARASGLERVGFPGDAYVLALVGGTGVGKSSILNALAGGAVSPASVRRPTTAEPVAWIPRDQRESLEPLLSWLGVSETREHEPAGLGQVAILDLPDMDSVAAEHRQRVEALLPLVDAVVWVTDPEKYADAVLHDEFLRAWLPRVGRQVVVVNKSDRLTADDARRLQRDLEADLASGVIRGSDVEVLGASAVAPEGLDALRSWLADSAEAKSVIRSRIAASISATARDLAWQAGEGLPSSGRPFLDDAAREATVRAAEATVLRVVDVPGLEQQVVAATRAAARARGTGPLGHLTSFLYRASGRETAVADPTRFLLRWRERAGLGPAVEAVREGMSAPIRDAPPAIRPALAATVDPAQVRGALERAVDRAVRDVGTIEPPKSRWWGVLGLLQTLASAGIALSAAWVVLWILVRPETGSIVLPVVGPVPSPFVSLVTFLLVGYLLARLVGWHARWLGSRWAARARDRITAGIDKELRAAVFSRLDEVEDARRRLVESVQSIERSCAG